MTAGEGGATERSATLLDVLVQLTDTLITDFDVVDVLEGLARNCVELLGVDDAGLMLTDQRGGLQVMASTSTSVHALELFQLSAGQGPCLDAFRTRTQVHAPDVAGVSARWPRFAARAGQVGVAGVHALPMRCREHTLGAINLFSATVRPLDPTMVRAGQALADVASTAVLQHRTLAESHRVTEQLQHALTHRVIIEQAKGRLSERHGLSVEEVFAGLRAHARANNLKLSDLAQAATDRAVDTALFLGPVRPPPADPGR